MSNFKSIIEAINLAADSHQDQSNGNIESSEKELVKKLAQLKNYARAGVFSAFMVIEHLWHSQPSAIFIQTFSHIRLLFIETFSENYPLIDALQQFKPLTVSEIKIAIPKSINGLTLQEFYTQSLCNTYKKDLQSYLSLSSSSSSEEEVEENFLTLESDLKKLCERKAYSTFELSHILGIKFYGAIMPNNDDKDILDYSVDLINFMLRHKASCREHVKAIFQTSNPHLGKSIWDEISGRDEYNFLIGIKFVIETQIFQRDPGELTYLTHGVSCFLFKYDDVVIKLVLDTQEPLFTNEVACLKNLDHDNIVGYISLANLNPNYMVIPLEYMNRDCLFKYLCSPIEDQDVNELQQISLQIVDGLTYLAKLYIVHYDIKPENILLHQEGNTLKAKIGDFGFARFFENSEKTIKLEPSGTTDYAHPELLNNNELTVNFKQAQQHDIYPLGLMLLMMVTCFSAYNMDEQQGKLTKLAGNPPPHLEKLPTDFQDIVTGCCLFGKRKTAMELPEIRKELAKDENPFLLARNTFYLN